MVVHENEESLVRQPAHRKYYHHNAKHLHDLQKQKKMCYTTSSNVVYVVFLDTIISINFRLIGLAFSFYIKHYISREKIFQKIIALSSF